MATPIKHSSGGIVFQPTPEELEIMELREKVKELEDKVALLIREWEKRNNTFYKEAVDK